MAIARARIFTFLCYPDSIPTDFERIIEDEITTSFIMSPLHDMDIPEEGKKGYNGTPYKKPHWHCMISFENCKSFAQVIELTRLLGAERVEQVHSTKAMIRYFYHADQPKKAQYKKEDLRAWNGADVEALHLQNDKEIFGAINDLLSIIDQENITEYCDFVNFIRGNKNTYADYFHLIIGTHSFFLNNYIKSMRFKSLNR
jgi:hypothetical protein